MTATNSAMRTPAFCKTFIKSFCAGLLRVLAQAPLTRGVGQTAPQMGVWGQQFAKQIVGVLRSNKRRSQSRPPSQPRGYTYLGVTKKIPKGRAFGTKKWIFSKTKKIPISINYFAEFIISVAILFSSASFASMSATSLNWFLALSKLCSGL